MSEIVPTPAEAAGVLPSVYLNYLGTLGNHEIKMLAAGIMLAEPEASFTSTRLSHEFGRRLGGTSGERSSPTRLSRFGNSFVRSGLFSVPEGANLASTATPYRAREDLALGGLATLGAVMDWSVVYPDLSVQKLLGHTAEEHELDSAEVRLRIFDFLLRHSGPAPSIAAVGRAFPAASYHYNSPWGQINRMARLGFLDVETKYGNVNPSFSMVGSPAHCQEVIESSSATPTRRLIYRAVADVPAGEEVQLTLNDILERCRPHLRHESEADLAKVRQLLVRRLDAPRILQRIYDPEDDPSQMSRVSIRPSLRAPIGALCDRVGALGYPDKSEELAARALEIVHTGGGTAFHVLIEKAQRFEQIKKNMKSSIVTALQVHRRLTVDEMVDFISAERGQVPDRESVAGPLRRMQRAGLLISAKRRRSDTSGQEVLCYGLNPYQLLFAGEDPFQERTEFSESSAATLARQHPKHNYRSKTVVRRLEKMSIHLRSLASEGLINPSFLPIVVDLFSKWEAVLDPLSQPPLITGDESSDKDLLLEAANAVSVAATEGDFDLSQTVERRALTRLLCYRGPAFAVQWINGDIVEQWARGRSQDPGYARQCRELFTRRDMRVLAHTRSSNFMQVIDQVATNYFEILSPENVVEKLKLSPGFVDTFLTFNLRRRIAMDYLDDPLGRLYDVRDNVLPRIDDENLARLLYCTPQEAAEMFPPYLRWIAALSSSAPLKLFKHAKLHLETTLTDERIAEQVELPLTQVQLIFMPWIRSYFAVNNTNDPLRACSDWIARRMSLGLLNDALRDRQLPPSISPLPE